jgi:uncharacterized protein
MMRRINVAKWNAAPYETGRAIDSQGMQAPQNRLGRINLLQRMLRAVNVSPAGGTKQLFRRKASHFLRCAIHLEAYREVFGDRTNPALQEALASRPSLITCVIHSYLNVDWRFDHKLQAISDHYRLLSGPLSVLRFVPPASIVLADIGDAIQIRLHRLACFEHEGEVSISLFGDDLRLYSLTFMLGQFDRQLVAYAGGLQGLRSPEAVEIYRSLTHRMHGLRPRDLMVTAFRLLCGSLGVMRIFAISDRKRICSNSDHSPKDQIFCSYDAAWIECGGIPVDDAFFELSPQLVRRSSRDIPSRKRAQYRRRYEMIDKLLQQISAAVKQAPQYGAPHEDRSGAGGVTSSAAAGPRPSQGTSGSWNSALP